MSAKTLVELYRAHAGKVSDKWSSYLPVYEEAFAPLRDRKVSLLEIGIQNGGSLEIYSRYFPTFERLVGCDINPDCGKLKYQDPRIRVVVADANTDDGESRILKIAGSYDIILDDGSHTSTDIVRSFARYWRHLRPGGVYLAEDLHCSYWREFGGGLYDPMSSISFFKALADIIHQEHWGLTDSSRQRLANFARFYGTEFGDADLEEIHSVHFFNSVCIIRKELSGKNRLGRRILAGLQDPVIPADRTLHNRSINRSDQSANDQAKDPLHPPETTAQLYLSGNGRFTEIQSLAIQYPIGIQKRVLFPFKGLAAMGRGMTLSLRLDPSNRAGVVRVGRLRLLSSEPGAKDAAHEFPPAILQPSGNLLPLKDSDHTFLSTGPDPHIILPPVEVGLSSFDCLEAELGFYPSGELLEHCLGQIQGEISDLNNDLLDLGKRLEAKDRVLAERLGEIAQLKEDLEKAKSAMASLQLILLTQSQKLIEKIRRKALAFRLYFKG